METLPILLLTGYLGSGKTTLVNHILANQRGIRFAVIVNDIGEVNIDADLIQKGGIVGQTDDSLVALQNGCICCTLKMDLVQQIEDIVNMRKFDYIVIEASGICEPEPIAQTIVAMQRASRQQFGFEMCRLDSIVTVVDALRLQSEFACGDSLVKENIDEEEIENLIIQQIEFCNIIVLNKVSEIGANELHRIKEIIRALQPHAKIIESDYTRVDLQQLLDTHGFDFDKVSLSAAWVQEFDRAATLEEEEEARHHHHHHEHEHEHEHHHHEHECDNPDCTCHHHHHHEHEGGEVEEYGIGTFVYYRRRPFNFDKFNTFVTSKWNRNIIRSKGVCYFGQNPDMSYLFEQAGVQKKLVEAGQWFCTAPEEELNAMVARDPSIMRDWDEVYGDRMQKIVFIGQKMEQKAIVAALDDCLE